jgi:hypothetical protein
VHDQCDQDLLDGAERMFPLLAINDSLDEIQKEFTGSVKPHIAGSGN